jgi:hypothetical protein
MRPDRGRAWWTQALAGLEAPHEPVEVAGLGGHLRAPSLFLLFLQKISSERHRLRRSNPGARAPRLSKEQR